MFMMEGWTNSDFSWS